MLLDHRTYTVRAGCLRKQMALYEKHGLAVQKRHFGEPLAWLVAETGDVNSYVHIWVYEDAADRSRRRGWSPRPETSTAMSISGSTRMRPIVAAVARP